MTNNNRDEELANTLALFVINSFADSLGKFRELISASEKEKENIELELCVLSIFMTELACRRHCISEKVIYKFRDIISNKLAAVAAEKYLDLLINLINDRFKVYDSIFKENKEPGYLYWISKKVAESCLGKKQEYLIETSVISSICKSIFEPVNNLLEKYKPEITCSEKKEIVINSEIIDKIIKMLNQDGYDDYAIFENDVSIALKKLDINKIIYTGNINNAIREKKEVLKLFIQQIEKKIEFLTNNEHRLNNWNKERLSDLKNLKRENMNLRKHEQIDKLLSSNFSEEEIRENGFTIYLSDKEQTEKTSKHFQEYGFIKYYSDSGKILFCERETLAKETFKLDLTYKVIISPDIIILKNKSEDNVIIYKRKNELNACYSDKEWANLSQLITEYYNGIIENVTNISKEDFIE